MSEISLPYIIADLPQTSKQSLQARLSGTFAPFSSSRLYLGVSHSSISEYTLKSTATSTWSFPISPVTQVTCVYAVSEEEIYYATQNTKGKGSLHCMISKKHNKDHTQQAQKEYTLLTNTEPILEISKSKSEEILYIVFQNGEVAAFSLKKETPEAESNETAPEEQEEDKKPEEKNHAVNDQIIFSAEKLWNINYKDDDKSVKSFKCLKSKIIRLSKSKESLIEDGIAVLIIRNPKSKSLFKILTFSLEPSQGRLMNAIDHPSVDCNMDIAFDITAGFVYSYDPSRWELSKVSTLNKTAPKTSMIVPQIKDESTKSPHFSLLFLGNDQLLISFERSLKLVDLRNKVIVSERTLEKYCHLTMFSKKLSVAIGYTQPLESSTANTAVGPDRIMAIPLVVGKGTLFEIIGKGISTNIVDNSKVNDLNRWSHAIPKIASNFGADTTGSVFGGEQKSQAKNSKRLATFVLKMLEYFKEQKDLENFELWGLTYFKTSTKWDISSTLCSKSPEEILQEFTLPQISEQDKETEFQVGQGRATTFTTVLDICNLVFNNVILTAQITPLSSLENFGTDSKHPKLVKISKSFFPKLLVKFLLTHPLFPTQQLPGILLALSKYPDLVELALKKLPSLRCDTVVSALKAEDNDNIFKAAISRLEQNYEPHEITASVKRVFLSKITPGSTKGEDLIDIAFKDNSVTLEQCIKHMCQLNIGWEILPYIIDAGGLFGWDESFLNEFESIIEASLVDLNDANQVLTVIDEITANSVPKKKGSSKSESASNNVNTNNKGPVLVTAAQHSKQRLNNTLGLSTQKSRRKSDKSSFSSIGIYSIEKLIL